MAAGTRVAELSFSGTTVLVISAPCERAPLGLTRTELAIAKLLMKGASLRLIASARERSIRTVANQVQRIYRKLGVASREELVVRWQQGAVGEHTPEHGG